jgi:gamma-glutamylcyclotransferase (GGCT)/AIG2-like uncharacterized protein YtfP
MPPTAPLSHPPSSRLSGPLGQSSEDLAALFVYGTLQFPEVLEALLGRVPTTRPATVLGWRVAALPGRVYPALVPADKSANGLLVAGLTPGEWEVIDAFEDDLYELRRLTLIDGQHGWAYVWKANEPASPDDWDSERFGERDLEAYADRCRRWRDGYEAKVRRTNRPRA